VANEHFPSEEKKAWKQGAKTRKEVGKGEDILLARECGGQWGRRIKKRRGRCNQILSSLKKGQRGPDISGTDEVEKRQRENEAELPTIRENPGSKGRPRLRQKTPRQLKRRQTEKNSG